MNERLQNKLYISLTSTGSWSGGTSPNSSDRLFIFNKSPNLNNGIYDFECSYLFIDSNSNFNVTNNGFLPSAYSRSYSYGVDILFRDDYWSWKLFKFPQ